MPQPKQKKQLKYLKILHIVSKRQPVRYESLKCKCTGALLLVRGRRVEFSVWTKHTQEEFHTVIVRFFNHLDPEISEDLKTLIPDVETLKFLIISVSNSDDITAGRIFTALFLSSDWVKIRLFLIIHVTLS